MWRKVQSSSARGGQAARGWGRRRRTPLSGTHPPTRTQMHTHMHTRMGWVPCARGPRLLTSPRVCPIPQVPMRQVSMEAMEALLLQYKGRYTTVVRGAEALDSKACAYRSTVHWM